MRICLVSPYFPSHRIPHYIEGIFLLREAKQLQKQGHKFFVVACQHGGLPKFEIVEGIPVYRVSSITVPKIQYPLPNLFQLISTIVKISRKHRIQLLDFWGPNYLTSIPILFLNKMIDVPITITVGGLPGINWFYGEKIVDLMGLIYSVLLAKFILAQADGIRTEFLSMNKDLSRLGIPDNKVHVIYRGIDTGVFCPRSGKRNRKTELRVNHNNVVILFSGRLEKVKGLDYLVEAIRHLVKEYDNLTFMFVGEGTLRRKYEKMTQTICRCVRFLGFRSDVCQIMNTADIFVLPSISESAAISVLEASACGLPVVASKVGAIPEIIKDGVNGICVTPKNSYELAKALRKLITNLSLAKEMGKRGAILVRQSFSQEIVARKVAKYYQQFSTLNT